MSLFVWLRGKPRDKPVFPYSGSQVGTLFRRAIEHLGLRHLELVPRSLRPGGGCYLYQEKGWGGGRSGSSRRLGQLRVHPSLLPDGEVPTAFHGPPPYSAGRKHAAGQELASVGSVPRPLDCNDAAGLGEHVRARPRWTSAGGRRLGSGLTRWSSSCGSFRSVSPCWPSSDASGMTPEWYVWH